MEGKKYGREMFLWKETYSVTPNFPGLSEQSEGALGEVTQLYGRCDGSSNLLHLLGRSREVKFSDEIKRRAFPFQRDAEANCPP